MREWEEERNRADVSTQGGENDQSGISDFSHIKLIRTRYLKPLFTLSSIPLLKT